MKGTMAGHRPAYELLCQAPHPDPRRARRGDTHGVVLGGSTVPMRFSGRILDEALTTSSIEGLIRITAVCRKCGVATEYIECTAEEASAA